MPSKECPIIPDCCIDEKLFTFSKDLIKGMLQASQQIIQEEFDTVLCTRGMSLVLASIMLDIENFPVDPANPPKFLPNADAIIKLARERAEANRRSTH